MKAAWRLASPGAWRQEQAVGTARLALGGCGLGEPGEAALRKRAVRTESRRVTGVTTRSARGTGELSVLIPCALHRAVCETSDPLLPNPGSVTDYIIFCSLCAYLTVIKRRERL